MRTVAVLTAVVVALGLAELGARLTRPDVRSNDGFFFVLEPFSGYRPRPGVHRCHRIVDGVTSYEATYTVGSDGWRTGGAGEGPPILLLGCSFTFGIGVNDADTVPAALAEHTGVATLNRGVGGWGPHNVLGLLQSGALDAERPRAVVLEVLASHVERAAGRVGWSAGCPRYELDEAGRLRRVGGWEGHRPWWSSSALLSRLPWRSPPSDHDLRRFVALCRAVRDECAARWSVPFLVLAWESGEPFEPEVWSALRAAGFTLVETREELPWPELRQQLIPGDRHPTGDANRRVARLLARRLGLSPLGR